MVVYIVKLFHVMSEHISGKKGRVTCVCPTTHNNTVQNRYNNSNYVFTSACRVVEIAAVLQGQNCTPALWSASLGYSSHGNAPSLHSVGTPTSTLI
jgi:hypothetical protein